MWKVWEYVFSLTINFGEAFDMILVKQKEIL